MADEEKAEDAPAEGEEPAEEAPEGEAAEGDGEEGEGEDGEEGEDEEGEEGEGEEGEDEGEGEGEEGEGEVAEGEEGIISDESDVFNELMNAGGQAREAAHMIQSLKASVKEFQTKEMLSAEDAAILQAKQDELMGKLSEFGALTVRIQTLLQLSHLTESQLCLLDGPLPDEEEETFDMEIEDESLPKVIICGSEDHIPRIVVCEPTEKKEPPLLKCCCARHPILGGFGDDTPSYKGDIAMDALLKQLGSLQQEMKLINEENNFLSKKLSEIVDKSRCPVCNKPKALCRCDKPTLPPPCCVPPPPPPCCPPMPPPCCPPMPPPCCPSMPPPCCPPMPPPCCPPMPPPCCPPKPKPPCCPPKPKPPCCPPIPPPPPCCPPKPPPCPPVAVPPPCCPPKPKPPCCPPKPKPICNCPLPQKPPCLCCPPCQCSGTPCCCSGGPMPPCGPVPCPPDPPLCSCCQQADKGSSTAITQMETRLRNMITDVSKMQCQLRDLQRLRQQLEEEKSDLCPCFDDLFS